MELCGRCNVEMTKMIKRNINVLKARTHRTTFRGFVAESVVESADSSSESADSTTDFMPVGRLPVLNMVNICTLIQSADENLPTFAVGRLQNVLVGMGLELQTHTDMKSLLKEVHSIFLLYII